MATILDYALTTKADVKESLGIASGDTSKDNLIIRKINQATEMIERFCSLPKDHHFAQTAYEDELYNGTGTLALVLKMFPIVTGETFTLEERAGNLNQDDWTTVDTENYHIDYKAGFIEGVATFIPGIDNYRINYTAGYDPIPADLAEACVALASFLVDNATTGTSIKRKREGQREIEYHQPNQSDSKSIIKSLGLDDILAPYGHEPLQDAR